MLHQERDGVAAFPTSEAVIDLFLDVDVEGGGLLGVERAEPDEVTP